MEEKNKTDNIKLYQEIFKEDFESLDDEDFIRQYLHITKENYYIGIENISNKKAKINFKLKCLMINIKEKINEINFDIDSKTKKVFSLKYINNFIGEISFSFEVHFY